MFTLMLPFEYVKDSEVKQCTDMSGKNSSSLREGYTVKFFFQSIS